MRVFEKMMPMKIIHSITGVSEGCEDEFEESQLGMFCCRDSNRQTRSLGNSWL